MTAMTDNAPATELRAAAARIRALVTAISPPDPAALAFHADGAHVTQGAYGLYDVATTETPECAAYIAAMGPPVALALADWLESAAVDAEQIGPDPHALAVARSLTP